MDERKIVIEVVGKSVVEEETTSIVKGSGDVNVDLKTLLHPIRSVENAVLGKSVLLNQAYQEGKKLVIQAVQTSVNQYFSLSENYFAETSWNNAMTTISKATSFGSSVVGGAIAGSVGGVYGAIAGGVVAGVSWGVSELISGRNRMSSYYANLNATRINTEFMQRRAGLYDNNRGTEN